MASRKQDGACCSAYGCSRKFNKNDNARLHSFPLKNEELLKKWLVAMRREAFFQQNIPGDHFKTSDYFPFSRELLKTSVPSVFGSPSHLQKVKSERRPLKRKVIKHDDDTSRLTPSTSKSIKLSPSKEE